MLRELLSDIATEAGLAMWQFPHHCEALSLFFRFQLLSSLYICPDARTKIPASGPHAMETMETKMSSSRNPPHHGKEFSYIAAAN